jgi:hypothetical protein
MEMSAGPTAGRRGPRLPPALWTIAGSLLVSYILLLLVAIIYRHPKRFDFTAERENTLSKETLSRLALLNQEVQVVFPYIFQIGSPLDDMKKQILARSRLLLDEYINRQPRIRLEAILNVALTTDAEAWKLLCDKYDLAPSLVNRFIFISADGKTRVGVSPEDLADYDKVTDPREKGQVHEFRAQQAFTAAITSIIYREKKRAYLVTDLRGPSVEDRGLRGLSVFREKMDVSGLALHPLAIHTESAVPADCDLLIIASPESRLEAEDRRKINDYLVNGGRLLATLGPADSGLEELLDLWGVRVVNGLLYQRQFEGPRADWKPTFRMVGGFNPRHAITSPFSQGAFEVLVSNARTLELRDTGGLHGEHLLRTGDDPPTIVDQNRNGRQDDQDPVGPKVVAAAVWRPKPARPLPDARFIDTRLVVIGETAPLLNQQFGQYTHREFLQNCVSWLVGREEQVAGESSAWTERRIKSSPGIERFLFWVPICLFPGITICFGTFIYFLRRS